MNVSLFGYNFNLEVLILIGVVYLILVGHTICSTCNVHKIMEGLTDMVSDDASGNIQSKKAEVQQKIKNAKTNLATQSTAGTTTATPDTTTATPDTTTTIPDTTTTSKEGFTGANINYGESSMYDLNSDHPVDTSSWSAQNMTVVPGQPLSEGVKKFLARPQQKLPLPEGEMDFFANTKFAPEFCPGTYSNSSGCAEMSGSQYNYLKTRGGNNVPYSEY
jgi:hypothetical protein